MVIENQAPKALNIPYFVSFSIEMMRRYNLEWEKRKIYNCSLNKESNKKLLLFLDLPVDVSMWFIIVL